MVGDGLSERGWTDRYSAASCRCILLDYLPVYSRKSLPRPVVKSVSDMTTAGGHPLSNGLAANIQ